MRTPGSCIRCAQPLAVESDGELCPVCQLSVETSRSVGGTPRSTPEGSDTVSADAAPPAADSLTASCPAHPATESDTSSVSAADPRASLPPSPPGYDLIRHLGGGGMGDVYLGRAHASERLVAIKFIRGGRAACERFLVEVRALGALDHPNIVRVLSEDFQRRDPYFTMEYMAEGSLSDLVKARGPLTADEAARLIGAVAGGLEFAHAKNVFHRDLKPSNILLGADGTPKLGDFGLAKRMDKDDGVTIGSGPLGTPGFMPPEQISTKNGAVGPWSDVYGLGATLYHLLSGRPPFVGDTPTDTMSKVLADPPERLRSVRPEVPAALEGIVVKCLEKEPTDRYPTAAALAEDLERFLTGQKPAAPELTPLRRAKRWAARNRARLGMVAATVAVAAVLVAAWPAMAPVRPRPEQPAVSSPLEQLSAELSAGRKTVLIPTGGKPRWHRWVLGSPEIGFSPTGDGNCSIEAMGQSMLELCPDPMSNWYRIRAEIQFVQTKVPVGFNQPGQVDESTMVGVYFGYSAAPGADDAVARTMFMVTFNDAPPRPILGGIRERAISLRRFGMLTGPKRPQVSNKLDLCQTLLIPPVGQTGPWRVIEIEVTAGRVQAWWEEPNGHLTSFADVTTDALRASYAGFRERLDAKAPGHGIALPVWTPRMPIGIWNERAAIALRNVTITPLH